MIDKIKHQIKDIYIRYLSHGYMLKSLYSENPHQTWIYIQGHTEPSFWDYCLILEFEQEPRYTNASGNKKVINYKPSW